MRSRRSSTTEPPTHPNQTRIRCSWCSLNKRDETAINYRDHAQLFNELASLDQDAIYQKMARRVVANTQASISEGRFLEFAPARVIRDFFAKHPELFLDGKCWDHAYASLDYGRPHATQEAQIQVVRYYESLLADVAWLADQDGGEIASTNRTRLLRAQLAIELLVPSSEANER